MLEVIPPSPRRAVIIEATPAQPSLADVLKRYFGFSTFRPLQRDIIEDALAGRDVVALLPTGGGKSLCFQLPAMMRRGLTVVVSPLIALMKDQVDALDTAGVPATFLNSSIDGEQVRARMAGLREGRYRLLYVAPERLVMPSFLSALQALDVRAIAVDEAHCISAWGHDFRPEYRRLAELRDVFPDASIMALSATATERVRADIAASLRLRDPRFYVASFNRPNLTYRVEAKEDPKDQLLAFVGARRDDCGIVYAQSRSSVERLADVLRGAGISAAAYHAGMDSADRARVHDAFSRDQTKVVCATVAFGMGINKPNVRFVVHHDLPKDIESYYQETGRAGRDGLPSECVLLFKASDAVKQARFLDEKTDPAERARAKKKLDQMVHFAELATCRRAALLGYFGEDSEAVACGACDNCVSPRESYDGTIAAQKLLSCILRIRQKSDLSVGLAHVAAVLVGSNREQVRRLGHHELSTYGIGKELDRGEWQAVGRELSRLGLLEHTGDRFPGVQVTAKGREVLTKRMPVMLTRAVAAPKTAQAPTALACDEVLLTSLRALRRNLAEERDVPAYVIFSDVSLRQMAREYPVDVGAFRRINGVGEKKLADLGATFMREIGKHIEEHGKQSWDAAPARPAAPARALNETARETLRLLREGEPIDAIAARRSLTRGTITGHIASAIEAGEAVDIDRLLPADQRQRVEEAFAQLGEGNLTGVLERLGEGFDYGLCRIVRAARHARPENEPREGAPRER